MDDVPAIESEEDFEISQFPKARGKQGVQTYEVLRESATVAETCANWEVLFLQFRDASGKSLLCRSSSSCIMFDAMLSAYIICTKWEHKFIGRCRQIDACASYTTVSVRRRRRRSSADAWDARERRAIREQGETEGT